jgi:hypothetical protein
LKLDAPVKGYACIVVCKDNANLSCTEHTGRIGSQDTALGLEQWLDREDIKAFLIGPGVVSVELRDAGSKVYARDAVVFHVFDDSRDDRRAHRANDREQPFVLDHPFKRGQAPYGIKLVVGMPEGDGAAIDAAGFVHHSEVCLDACVERNADDREAA